MDNILQNKTKFIAQHYGLKVLRFKDSKKIREVSYAYLPPEKDDYLELRHLSSITDTEAIHVARLAHQMLEADFKILRRDKDMIHVEYPDKIGIKHHISMLYNYGTVCANMWFPKHGDTDSHNSTVNIGQISLSSERPVPYIAILDYLRSRKFAMPFHDLSVKKQVEYGWIKLIQ